MGGNSATPLASDSPCLVWREIVVVKIRTALRQQQQQLDDLLVQVTPKSDAACWCVGGSSGDGWWLCPFYQVYVLAFYIVASAASFFTVIYVCGFGVVQWCLTLSFPWAHGITRLMYSSACGVLCCSLWQRAAVCGISLKIRCSLEWSKNSILGQSEKKKNSVFRAPLHPRCIEHKKSQFCGQINDYKHPHLHCFNAQRSVIPP